MGFKRRPKKQPQPEAELPPPPADCYVALISPESAKEWYNELGRSWIQSRSLRGFVSALGDYVDEREKRLREEASAPKP